MAAHWSGGVEARPACLPEELVQLGYGEVGDLARIDREGRLARSAGSDDGHLLHSCLWCLRLVAEISPGPCAARLSAVVSVIGPVVTGVAIVTAVEHSAGERTRAELGRLRQIGNLNHPLRRFGPSSRLVGQANDTAWWLWVADAQ